jgi:hypothetical protein
MRVTLDSRLNTIGAALLGVVTVALAWLWAQQQRHTMSMLQQMVSQCEERNEHLNEQMISVYERYHKAIANVTYAETQNYHYADKHKDDRQQIYKLQAENDELSRQMDILKAAAAGRQPGRRDDDRAETP